jgi:hypothetical protein
MFADPRYASTVRLNDAVCVACQGSPEITSIAACLALCAMTMRALGGPAGADAASSYGFAAFATGTSVS